VKQNTTQRHTIQCNEQYRHIVHMIIGRFKRFRKALKSVTYIPSLNAARELKSVWLGNLFHTFYNR